MDRKAWILWKTWTVVPESVVASVETTENEKNSAVEFGRETLAETSVPQGAANSAWT
ncbi:MAG: hypothetical protein V8Q05_13635 [Lachnospiraceae bacterium]